MIEMNSTYIIYVQILLFTFKQIINVQNIFDDTMIDDQIQNVFIQINYSQGRIRIEIVRLSKNSFMRNRSQNNGVRIPVRLMDKDYKC
jgi:hypothetical protein